MNSDSLIQSQAMRRDKERALALLLVLVDQSDARSSITITPLTPHK